MIKFLISSLLIFSFNSTSLVEGIAGKWETTIDTEQGPFYFTVEYRVDGTDLSGTFESDLGTLDFDGGTINGNAFEYSFDMEGSEFKHSGKLDGDKIQLHSANAQYGDMDMTLTRVE